MSQNSQETFNEEQTVLRIKQYDDEINQLEEQLEIRRMERSQLMARLDLYRASIAPIRRVSEDVLVLIFSETIAESPRIVGRLLFVCRAWYRLVTNQPTLWSKIRSTPSADAKDVKRLTCYVKSAVRYSADMPLDIHLSLMDARASSWWMYVAARLVDVSDTEVNSDDEDVRLAMVRRWAELEHGASTFPPLKDYAHLLEQHLKSLTGKTGEVTRRWRSLIVFLDPVPSSMINIVPLAFPRYPSPLLESLAVHTPRRPRSLLVTGCLPDTPRLRTICWSSSPAMSLDSFIPCKTQVAHLQILRITATDDLWDTTRFENIQTLYLDFEPGNPFPESDSGLLAYPRLEELTIFGPIPVVVIERVHAPNLHTLRLLDSSSVYPVLDSSFRSSHLCTLFLYADVHDIVGVCKRFMARFNTIHDVVLLHYHDEVVIEIARDKEQRISVCTWLSPSLW